MVHGGNHAAPPPGREPRSLPVPCSCGGLAPAVPSPQPGAPVPWRPAAPRLALRVRPLLTVLLAASSALASSACPPPRSMPSAVAQRVHLPVHLARGLQAASLRKRGAWLGFRVREQRPRAALAFPPVGFFTEHMRPRPPGEVPRLPPGPRGPRRLAVACRVVTASERPGALGVLCRSRSPVRGKWPR